MITVIFLLQLLQRFLFAHFLRNGKPFYISCHLFLHFFLSDATNGGIGLQHTDIQDIVQLAEDAELGEFGNAGQEHKAKIRVARLQRAVKLRITLRRTGRSVSSCITSSKGASYSSIRTTTCRPVCSLARMMSEVIRSFSFTASSGLP